jgi:hypothetical protein
MAGVLGGFQRSVSSAESQAVSRSTSLMRADRLPNGSASLHGVARRAQGSREGSSDVPDGSLSSAVVSRGRVTERHPVPASLGMRSVRSASDSRGGHSGGRAQLGRGARHPASAHRAAARETVRGKACCRRWLGWPASVSRGTSVGDACQSLDRSSTSAGNVRRIRRDCHRGTRWCVYGSRRGLPSRGECAIGPLPVSGGGAKLPCPPSSGLGVAEATRCSTCGRRQSHVGA